MKNAAAQQALRQYAKVGTHSGVEFASPHRLIQMLMEGGLARLSSAAHHLRCGELAKKGENVGLAISIISGLQASLDPSHGGDIATNLDRLYDYMIRTLVAANFANDVAGIEEVQALLGQVKTGWDAIAGHAAAQEENAGDSGGDAQSAQPTSREVAVARV